MSSPMWARLWGLCGLVAFLLAPEHASAHAIGLSRGEYRVLPDGIEARLVFDRDELAGVVASRAPDARGAAEEATLESDTGRDELERRIVQRIVVMDRDVQRCAGRLGGLVPMADGGVSLLAQFTCRGTLDTTHVAIEFWDALSPGHRHLANVTNSDASASTLTDTREQLLYRGQPRLELGSLAATPRLSPLAWVRLGIEHILGGYDHLLFLLALVLVSPRLRALTATVSVFTLAHSVTLALSTLRVLSLPPGLVECAIALSIAYVGLENLTSRATRPRILVVFAFGLIHGFGFASALAELGLPQAQTPGALLAFNVGVELGQLGVLAVAFPVVQRCRRNAWFGPRGVPALSLGTALAGVFWFCVRV